MSEEGEMREPGDPLASPAPVEGPGLPDLLAPGLELVIVGYNPSLPAWRSGHYYANPTNSFYRLLYEGGLTPRLLRPEEDGLLLGYGIGATDLLAGCPSALAADLPARRYREATEGLRRKLEAVAPRLVCCNGLGVFRHLSGRRPAGTGLQEGVLLAGAPVYVVPSSSGAACALAAERREAWLRLGELVRAARDAGGAH